MEGEGQAQGCLYIYCSCVLWQQPFVTHFSASNKSTCLYTSILHKCFAPEHTHPSHTLTHHTPMSPPRLPSLPPQQSLKLVASPSVSVGKLMDERGWEGPTSHQAALVRDRLARDVYTLTEADAAERARTAALRLMAPAAAAAALAGSAAPVPQLPPRPGCYLAVRPLDAPPPQPPPLLPHPMGVAAAGDGFDGVRGCAPSFRRPSSGSGPFPPSSSSPPLLLMVVQLLDYQPHSGSTVVTLDKQQALVVDLSLPFSTPPSQDLLSSQGVGEGGGSGTPPAVLGAPFFVLTPPYTHLFTPIGSSAVGGLAPPMARQTSLVPPHTPIMPLDLLPPPLPLALALPGMAGEQHHVVQQAQQVLHPCQVPCVAPPGLHSLQGASGSAGAEGGSGEGWQGRGVEACKGGGEGEAGEGPPSVVVTSSRRLLRGKGLSHRALQGCAGAGFEPGGLGQPLTLPLMSQGQPGMCGAPTDGGDPAGVQQQQQQESGVFSPLQELQQCLANGMIPIGDANDAHGHSRPGVLGCMRAATPAAFQHASLVVVHRCHVVFFLKFFVDCSTVLCLF